MATLSDLVNDVLAEAPEAPDPLVERALRQAARLFCQQTRYWQDDVSVTLAANTPTYTLTLPTGTQLVDIVRAVSTDDGVLTRTTERDLAASDPDYATSTGRLQAFARHGANGVRVYRVPASAGTLAVTCALAPSRTGDTLDDRLFNDHGDTLVYGALARLMAMPRRDWSDTNQATLYGAQFTQMLETARSFAEDGFQRGVVRKVTYGGY